MTSALPIVTVPISATGDADVINARHYCAYSKMKCHASSLNSHVHLFEMDVGDSI
jgi:hypothetical protein